MRYVVFTMVATAPVLTLFAIALLSPEIKGDKHAAERFVSEEDRQISLRELDQLFLRGR